VNGRTTGMMFLRKGWEKRAPQKTITKRKAEEGYDKNRFLSTADGQVGQNRKAPKKGGEREAH